MQQATFPCSLFCGPVFLKGQNEVHVSDGELG